MRGKERMHAVLKQVLVAEQDCCTVEGWSWGMWSFVPGKWHLFICVHEMMREGKDAHKVSKKERCCFFSSCFLPVFVCRVGCAQIWSRTSVVYHTQAVQAKKNQQVDFDKMSDTMTEFVYKPLGYVMCWTVFVGENQLHTDGILIVMLHFSLFREFYKNSAYFIMRCKKPDAAGESPIVFLRSVVLFVWPSLCIILAIARIPQGSICYGSWVSAHGLHWLFRKAGAHPHQPGASRSSMTLCAFVPLVTFRLGVFLQIIIGG